MSTFASDSVAPQSLVQPSSEDAALSRLEKRLPPLLSVIGGMVDLTGFFTLGHVFTAHVTGNLVVAAAALVHAGPFNMAQALPWRRRRVGFARQLGTLASASQLPTHGSGPM